MRLPRGASAPKTLERPAIPPRIADPVPNPETRPRAPYASAGTASAQVSTAVRIASAEYDETDTTSRPMVTV